MTITPTSFEMVFGIPEIFGYIFVFIFGAAIGSFLNVVIHRVPREQSVVFPNSACPKCDSAIKPYDNLPIISWLLLRGKCRKCAEPIAWRYPAVEALTGMIFMVVYAQLGLSVMLPVGLIFAAVMIALVFIDAEHMILPNVITYPLLVFALLARVVLPMFVGGIIFPDMLQWPATYFPDSPTWFISLVGAVAGALAGGGSLWLVGEVWKRLRGVDAMGLGDVKMMFGVGALLGWRLAVLTIFLAAFTGAIVGVAMITQQKAKDMQTQIPFGIFLGTGALIAFLFGERMINWYLSYFS